MMRFRLVFLPIAAALLPFNHVNASTVTELVTFSANSFQAYPSGTPPVNPVNGSFTITLDPTVDYTNQTAGITLNSLNISLGSALAFNYDSTTGVLQVGGANAGANTVIFSPATNDFWLFIDNFSTTPSFDQVGYAQTTAGDTLFYTINHTGSVTVAPVPIPAALPLFSGALGLLGFWGRRGTRAAAQA